MKDEFIGYYCGYCHKRYNDINDIKKCCVFERNNDLNRGSNSDKYDIFKEISENAILEEKQLMEESGVKL